jgi:hypothetical protein
MRSAGSFHHFGWQLSAASALRRDFGDAQQCGRTSGRPSVRLLTRNVCERSLRVSPHCCSAATSWEIDEEGILWGATRTFGSPLIKYAAAYSARALVVSFLRAAGPTPLHCAGSLRLSRGTACTMWGFAKESVKHPAPRRSTTLARGVPEALGQCVRGPVNGSSNWHRDRCGRCARWKFARCGGATSGSVVPGDYYCRLAAVRVGCARRHACQAANAGVRVEDLFVRVGHRPRAWRWTKWAAWHGATHGPARVGK